jgi:Zn-finger nucleic acid-binding protein
MATARLANPTPAHCPRCPDQPMVLQKRNKVDIDVCPRCHGIWLDRYELDALTSQAIVFERYAAALAEDGDSDLLPSRFARPSPVRRRP